MLAEASDFFGGAAPYAGGATAAFILGFAYWVYRFSSRVMARGDQRDQERWEQIQADLARKDRENGTLRRLLQDETDRSEGYRARMIDAEHKLVLCQEGRSP